MSHPKLLLITASGLFGTNFYRYYQNLIPLVRKDIDLRNFDKEIILNNIKKCKYCLISAAVTNVDYCEAYPKEIKLIEKGTINLIKILYENKIKPIFISTDYVFDGKKGNYTELDLPNPINVYGQHKTNIETFIRATCDKYMIVRIGKQFSLRRNENNFMLQIIKDLKEGCCFVANDQIFTPTLIDDTIKSIIKLIDLDFNGVINVCNSSWSRMALTEIIVDMLNLNRNSIKSMPLSQLTTAPRPTNSSLCSNKFHSMVNFQFTSIVDSIGRSVKLCN